MTFGPPSGPGVQEVPLPDGGKGYVYAPYIPLYVHDCRPWYLGIWHLSWWRTLWDGLWAARRRRKGWRMRYAMKAVDQSMYRVVDLNPAPVVRGRMGTVLPPAPSDAEIERELVALIERAAADEVRRG